MIRTSLCLLLAFGLAGTALATGNDNLDIDKVNGSIHVPDNATVGKLSTVNGGIRIGANSHARSADTVNGGIDLDNGATIDSLETVNGGIRVGENNKVAKTVEAVNGSITLHAGAEVGGHVSNVNGTIKLEAAHVGGGLETSSGDIVVGANSRVEGGLLVNADHYGGTRLTGYIAYSTGGGIQHHIEPSSAVHGPVPAAALETSRPPPGCHRPHARHCAFPPPR